MKADYCHYLFLLFLISFTTGCSDNKYPGDEGEDDDVTGDQKFVMADTAYMTDIARDGNIYFANNIPNEKLPRKGDIICVSISSYTPYGMLGKVKNITKNSKQLTVETETVPLDEAFQNLKIDTSLNINDYITEIIRPDGEKYELKRICPIESKSGTSILPISFEIPPGIFQFHGSIQLNLGCDFNLEILDGIKDFKMIFRPECTFTSGIKIDEKIEKTYPLGTIKFKPIALGYLVIIPELKPTLVCGVDAGINIDMTLNYKISGEYGITYNGSTWNEINNTTPASQYFSVKPELNLSGTLYAGIDMSIGLGIYHPAVSLGTDLNFRLKVKGENIDLTNPEIFRMNPDLSVSAGVEGHMFIDISCFSLKLLQYESSGFEKYFPLYKFYLFPGYSDINVDVQNKNIYFNYQMTSPPLFRMDHGYAIFKGDNIMGARYHVNQISPSTPVSDYNGYYENLSDGIYYISPICNVLGKEFYGKKTQFEIKKNILQWMDHNIGYYTFSEARSACPEGYRLPTSSELWELIENPMTRTGGWTETSPGTLHIQLPGGDVLHLPTDAGGSGGAYWSSQPGGAAGYYLTFTRTEAYVTKPISLGDQWMTAAVRCVKE